jgi:hypothetical protein
VLSAGEPVPTARVWLGPRERVELAEVVEPGPALFLFYLFDWSST